MKRLHGHEGDEAIEAVRERPFDVILLDLGLPRSERPAVGKAILDLRLQPAMLAVTAVDDLSSRRRFFRIGFRGYVNGATRASASASCRRSGPCWRGKW